MMLLLGQQNQMGGMPAEETHFLFCIFLVPFFALGFLTPCFARGLLRAPRVAEEEEDDSAGGESACGSSVFGRSRLDFGGGRSRLDPGGAGKRVPALFVLLSGGRVP